MTKMEWLATAFEISPINRQTIHDALPLRGCRAMLLCRTIQIRPHPHP
ncbi:MAG: hypothetical protein ACLR8S_06270 [Paraprevotella clara]